MAAIKRAIQKTYGKRGGGGAPELRRRGRALAHLHGAGAGAGHQPDHRGGAGAGRGPAVRAGRDGAARRPGRRAAGRALPTDGTFPTATAQWEKRNLALEIPVWDPEICIQCGKCVLVCPHAVIREKVYPAGPEATAPGDGAAGGAPETFKSAPARWREFEGWRYTLQVAEDCTGCALCVEACPVKDKRATGRKAINMAPQAPLRAPSGTTGPTSLTLPDVDRSRLDLGTIKDAQLCRPLFEFQCLRRLREDALPLAPDPPVRRPGGDRQRHRLLLHLRREPAHHPLGPGRGRARAGLGQLPLRGQRRVRAGLPHLAGHAGRAGPRPPRPPGGRLDPALVRGLLDADDAGQRSEAGIAQRDRAWRSSGPWQRWTRRTPGACSTWPTPGAAQRLAGGGDGWAYDIGYGGLDHVLASGADVNVLVLDTEVYSNTGGSSPRPPHGGRWPSSPPGEDGAEERPGPAGDDLRPRLRGPGGHGASDTQTLKAFLEAEAHPGPS